MGSDLSKPVGQRIYNVRISNAAISDTKSYRVVTHNGLLTGLHNFDEIGKGQHINKTERSLTEFILGKLKEKKEIAMPSNMGEVVIKR